jgi:hypothetical protein
MLIENWVLSTQLVLALARAIEEVVRNFLEKFVQVLQIRNERSGGEAIITLRL